MARLQLVLFAVLLGILSAHASVGTVEETLIRAWAQRTRSNGWNLTTDFCNWRGLVCDASGDLVSMLITPASLGTIIYGDIPNIPLWTEHRTNGTAFTKVTFMNFTNYRTGPRLPPWFVQYNRQPPLNFVLETTPSLICYDDPCPFQADVPAGATMTNDTACEMTNDYSFSINLTCSNANIMSRTPDHGPQTGGTRVIIAVNVPLGFLDMTVSFGHEDGYSYPVPVEQLYFFTYVWSEVNNTNSSIGGTLLFFTSVIVVTSPPHPPGGVPLHIYAGDDRITKSFNVTYFYECPPGTISLIVLDPVTLTNESVCEPCPPGYYSNQFGSTECIPCAPGSYNPLYQQSSCSLCPAGTNSSHLAANSSDTCEPCRPGYVNPLPGQTVCQACSPGYKQNLEGMLQCDMCPAGYHAPNYASIECTICQNGTYQPDRGSTVCLFCPTATYSPNAGSTVCYPCLPGTTTPGRGSTACTPCDPGFYRPSTSTRCLQCAPGRYTDTAGLAICKLCNATTFNDAYNSTTCYSCAPQTTNVNRGSTGCERIYVRQTQNDMSLLVIGVLLVIVAVIVLICGVSYVVYRRQVQQKKKKELKKLRELMSLAPSSQ